MTPKLIPSGLPGFFMGAAMNQGNTSPATEAPDLDKSFNRFNAPYWAMMHGICAALKGDARWAVLSAPLYTFLPNVHPGRDRLEKMTGKARSTIDAARQQLKEVGLIQFDESVGGRFHTTRYELTDIRHTQVAAEIIERIRKVSADRTVSQPIKGSDDRQKGSDDRRETVRLEHFVVPCSILNWF